MVAAIVPKKVFGLVRACLFLQIPMCVADTCWPFVKKNFVHAFIINKVLKGYENLGAFCFIRMGLGTFNPMDINMDLNKIWDILLKCTFYTSIRIKRMVCEN